MSKKLTKISLMILTFVFAFCMSVAMLGMGNAYATDGAATFTMVNGASVRIDGVNGIRFAATVSEYNPDYEYGMILMPTDWVEKLEEESKTLNFTDVKEYDSTKTYGDNDVYFARGTNIPSTTSVITGTTVDNGYELTCSFVNIKTSNLSRTFTARAYYAPIVDGVADYTQATLTENMAVANIYTVISTYMVSDGFESLKQEYIDSENAQLGKVVEYVEGSVEAVTAVYTETDITVTGLTDGVAYRGGEAITVTATVSREDDITTIDKNEARTIDSGVKVEIERTVAADVDETLTYDEKTGEIALTTSGVFNVKATVGNTVKDTVATIKRSDVTVTINAVQRNSTAGTAAKDYTLISNEEINYSDFKYQYHNNMGNSVVMIYEVNDPENENATAIDSIDSSTDWLQLTSDGYRYLRKVSGKIVPMESKLTATYTDNYGIVYTKTIPVYGPTLPETYNAIKFDKLTADVDGDSVNDVNEDVIYGYMSGTYSLKINNVDLSKSNTDNLITFTVPNYVAGELSPFRRLRFRVIDANDENNYVDFLLSEYRNGSTNQIMGIAMNASTWTMPSGTIGFAGTNSATSITQMTTSSNYNTGRYISNISFKFLNTFTNTNIENVRCGFAIYNDEIYFNSKNSSFVDQQHNVFSKTAQTNLFVGDYANNLTWSGFTDNETTKVNILITPLVYRSAATTTTLALDPNYGAPILIDTINGVKVTANDVSRMEYVAMS